LELGSGRFVSEAILTGAGLAELEAGLTGSPLSAALWVLLSAGLAGLGSRVLCIGSSVSTHEERLSTVGAWSGLRLDCTTRSLTKRR
jgi:hypothetical protein